MRNEASGLKSVRACGEEQDEEENGEEEEQEDDDNEDAVDEEHEKWRRGWTSGRRSEGLQ